MTSSFNLVEEGFVPCIRPDGSSVELGLRDTLLQAHAIREVRDASPMVTIALHRLLLAVLYRALSPRSQDDWKSVWFRGQFDEPPVEDYLGRWHGRFDLLGREYPFFQVPGGTKEPLPPSALFEEQSCGNNPTLFDHAQDRSPAPLTLAAAARGLIGRQAFSIGFGKSPEWRVGAATIKTGYRTDAPLARGMTLLLRGDCLFETLVLNLIPSYGAAEADCAAWERDDPEVAASLSCPQGIADLLTWQSRRLRIEAADSPDGEVEAVHFAQGRILDKSEFDPMKTYSRDEQRGWLPHALSEGRALWRDSGALLRLVGDDSTARPLAALNLVAVMAGVIGADRTIRMDAFGASTEVGKAGKVTLWRHDTLPLPIAYLKDAALVDLLRQALEAAEEVGRELHGAVWLAAKELLGSGADRGRLSDLAQSIAPERLYWSRLEVPFFKLMARLPASGAGARQVSVSRWVCETVCRTAVRAFDETAGGINGSARMLRAVVAGRGHLQSSLGRITSGHREVLDECRE